MGSKEELEAEVISYIGLIEKMIKHINSLGKIFDTTDLKLKAFEFKQQTDEAIQNNIIYEFGKLAQRAKELKNELTHSEVFKHYILEFWHINDNHQEFKNCEIDSKQELYESKIHNQIEEIEEIKNSKTLKKLECSKEEIKEEIAKEYKDTIEKLKAEIAEKQALLDKQAEELKQKEAQIEEMQNRYQFDSTFVERLFHRLTGNAITINESLRLNLNLLNRNDQLMVKTFSLYNLPKIKDVSICLEDEFNQNLYDFFKNSGPESLEIMFLTCNDYLEIKDYIDAMVNMLEKTTREIYLTQFIIDYDDLSKIVRASRNCKRLLITYSNILPKGTLDFGTDLEYKTEYLGFDTLFDSDEEDENEISEEEFAPIIDKIKSSTLINSLTKMDIYGEYVTEVFSDFNNVVIGSVKPIELEY